ncbi:MAG: hypothetical protein H7338_20325 [Candidatus Sericytochromatia bacterium]|nr:hypothetical protein [Candidatus Sericytochromatia bacterium]
MLHGMAGSGRSSALYQRYLALLKQGVPSESILVWAGDKNDWLTRLGEDWPEPIGRIEIHTFRGWVQQELRRWWPTLESEGRMPKADVPRHAPTFLAVESAQAFLDRVTTHCRVAGACYDETTLSKPAQIIQVLDALGRSVENRLDLTTVDRRLAQGYPGPDAEKNRFAKVGCCFDNYRKAVYRYRIFDQAMQLDVFGRLMALPRYQASLARFRYALIDTVDESYPIQQTLLRHLLSQVPSLVMACDANGGLREYLGADYPGALKLIEPLDTIHFEGSQVVKTGMLDFAKRLSMLVADPETQFAVPLPEDVRIILEPPPALRSEMIARVAACVLGAIGNGRPSKDIAIIAPSLDPLLVWALRERFKPKGLSLMSHGGGARLVDFRIVRCLLALAVMAYPAWGRTPRRLDLIELFELTVIDNPMLAHAIHDHLEKLSNGVWPIDPDAVDWAKAKWLAVAEPGYRRLWDWLKNWQSDHAAEPIDVLIHRAFGQLLVPRRYTGLGPNGDAELSPTLRAEYVEEIRQVKHLTEIAKTLRRLDKDLPPDPEWGDRPFELRLIDTLQSGMAAERPFAPDRDDDAFIHLHTPQSYTARGEDAGLQIWVDTSAATWYKSDIKTLTNARVLSVNWDGQPYDALKDERDQARSLGRLVLSVLLKAKDRVHVFSSQHDAEGRELFGDLPDRIESLLR